MAARDGDRQTSRRSRVSLRPRASQTPFQRRFVSYVKRCDELERKLRYFKGEIDTFGLPVQVGGGLGASEQRSRG